MIKQLGDWAWVMASMGVVICTLMFLGAVRWWTDALGRVIAAVLVSISTIVGVSMLYYMGVPIPSLLWTRLVLYTAFGMAIWAAVITFVWSQFVAPRVKRRKNAQVD
jgi:flagellar motor component MotA